MLDIYRDDFSTMMDHEQAVDDPPETEEQHIPPMEERLSVLVVDDEPRILTSMSALLEDDFSVLTSTNAEKLSGFWIGRKSRSSSRTRECPA